VSLNSCREPKPEQLTMISNSTAIYKLKTKNYMGKIYFQFLNPFSAIVEFTNHLSFEPGIQGAEPPWRGSRGR